MTTSHDAEQPENRPADGPPTQPADGSNAFLVPVAGQRGDHNVQNNYFSDGPRSPVVVGPVVVGPPPELASAFQPRQGLRDQVVAARHRGEDVVLAQRETGRGGAVPGTRVLAGGGDVGKSQLAAWFAHDATAGGTDLVMWVVAASADQVITSCARAAKQVGALGAEGIDPAADAAALVEWLHTTDQSGRPRRHRSSGACRLVASAPTPRTSIILVCSHRRPRGGRGLGN